MPDGNFDAMDASNISNKSAASPVEKSPVTSSLSEPAIKPDSGIGSEHMVDTRKEIHDVSKSQENGRDSARKESEEQKGSADGGGRGPKSTIVSEKQILEVRRTSCENPQNEDERANERGEKVWKPTADFYLAVMALCTLTFAVAIDGTSISITLPIMSEALDGTALQAFWSGTSFLLASTVFQPPIASLSSIVGRRYAIYGSCIFFAAGSLVAALSNNYTVLITGRTIQGVGGGSLIALTEVVLVDLVPLLYRGVWFAWLSGMWAIGTVSGPLIGAGFAQNVTWRWIFYINLPIIAVGLLFVIVFLRQVELPGTVFSKLARFDLFGSVLFTIGATSFLFGVSVGGTIYEWTSWRTITPLILGPCIMVAFAVWEMRFATEPIIGRHIFGNWSVINIYIQTIFHGMILWSLLYFLPLYYQAVQLYSPVVSAVACLPETLTVAPADGIVGVVFAVVVRYRWALWSGWAITILGAGLLYLLGPNTTVVQWIFLNLPIGIGTGMLFSAMAISIQASVHQEHNAQAAAFFSFLRNFGQSIGIAVSGVIFQNSFRMRLLLQHDDESLTQQAAALANDATAVVEMIKRMEPGTERTALISAFSVALQDVWLSLTGFAAAAFLLSLFVKGYSLDQEYVTSQGLREREKGDVSEGGSCTGEVRDLEAAVKSAKRVGNGGNLVAAG